MKLRASMLVGVLLLSVLAIASTEPVKLNLKPTDPQFYIYKDRGDRANHFIPSGWMGSNPSALSKCLKLNPGYIIDQDKKNYCIKITYSNIDPDMSWAGIYWQVPANNWGDKKGGFNLSAFKKVVFKAKGDKGGEILDFFVGGIKGQTEEGDSDEARLDGTELTKDWKEYTIDLKGLDFSHIIGGFGWAGNLDSNPNGLVFYLDDIRYEK